MFRAELGHLSRYISFKLGDMADIGWSARWQRIVFVNAVFMNNCDKFLKVEGRPNFVGKIVYLRRCAASGNCIIDLLPCNHTLHETVPAQIKPIHLQIA